MSEIRSSRGGGARNRIAGGKKAPIVASVLVMLFCCQPLGIAALIFSILSNSARSAGRIEEANKNADIASKCVNWGLVTGLIVIVLYVALVVVIGVGGSGSSY